jgi:hypothetical protein
VILATLELIALLNAVRKELALTKPAFVIPATREMIVLSLIARENPTVSIEVIVSEILMILIQCVHVMLGLRMKIVPV